MGMESHPEYTNRAQCIPPLHAFSLRIPSEFRVAFDLENVLNLDVQSVRRC